MSDPTIDHHYGQTMSVWVQPEVGERTTRVALRLGWTTSSLIKRALERYLPVAEKMADAHETIEET